LETDDTFYLKIRITTFKHNYLFN